MTTLEILEIRGEKLMQKVAALVWEVHRDQPLRTNWPTPEEALETWVKVYLGKPNAIALVAFYHQDIVGFLWAYEMFEQELEGPATYLQPLFGGGRRIFYVHDFGVKKSLRLSPLGGRVAIGLCKELLERAKRIGITTFAASTFPSLKFLPFRLYKKFGFKSLAGQPPNDKPGERRHYMSYEIQ